MIFLVSISKANIGHKMLLLCDFSLAAKDKKGGCSRANIADSAQTEYWSYRHLYGIACHQHKSPRKGRFSC